MGVATMTALSAMASWAVVAGWAMLATGMGFLLAAYLLHWLKQYRAESQLIRYLEAKRARKLAAQEARRQER